MYAEPATVNRADVTHKIELTLFFNGGGASPLVPVD